MTIMEMIRTDNGQLIHQLLNLSEQTTEHDLLTSLRKWCLDALSSEVAKEQVLYSRVLHEQFPSEEFKRQAKDAHQACQEFQKAVKGLYELETMDHEWPDWLSSTINLLKNKNQCENLFLDYLDKHISNQELGTMVTEFERAREANPEIDAFQTRNRPLTAQQV